LSPNPFPLPCLLYLSFALFLAALLWMNSDLLAEIPSALVYGLLGLTALLGLGWRLCRPDRTDLFTPRGTPKP